MAFNTNPGKQQFSATASQTAFTFNFAIFADTDLKVYKTPAGQVANDITDILALTTNYTVAINGTLGGTVTLNVGASVNDTVTIVRSLPLSRTTDYVTNGDLYADTLDADQDYQTYLTNDQNVQLQRAIIVPESLGNVSLKIPAPVGDAYLRWNATANALENDVTIPQKLIDATTQATNSANSATASASSATTSTNKALEAQHWANYTVDVAVPEGTGEFSAKHYATKAAQSLAGLSIDATPTNGSSNAVSSDGVFDSLALKAPLASPTFTGVPAAPTAAATTNTTQIATTAFVIAEISNDAVLKSGGTMTGAITALRETKVAMGANDIDLSAGNLFTKTISGATTLTVSNWLASGNANSFILELTNGGSAVITYPSGSKFAGGTAPTLTASGKDILGCYSHDGGTTLNWIILGKDVK